MTKELLSAWGVDYEAVKVEGDEAALAELKRLGPVLLPAVAVGDRVEYGWRPAAFAELVGVRYEGGPQLAPAELAARLDRILEFAQAAIREAPAALLEVKSPGRDRTIRNLAYHVFRVAAAFVDCLEGERFRAEWFAELAPPDTQTGERLAEHGDGVRERLRAWFAAAPESIYETKAQTYYGEQRVHDLLERTTWHCGQHTRQVYSLLEDNGEAPTVALDPGVFRGLPLPEQMW